MRALITGIAGQDGSYLAEHLLNLGYEVHGIVRQQTVLPNLEKIKDKITLMYGDVRDGLSIETAIQKSYPDEIYNLAGQVFVPTSWIDPIKTSDVNYGGLIRILMAVEKINTKIRVYQASTSEMFGNCKGAHDESTIMAPTSPYGVSKLAAHEACRMYREKGLYVCSGILFNHESPRRGTEMVTRKISKHVAMWGLHKSEPSKWPTLKLGTNTKRDWGFAGDYVKAMHSMMQMPMPDDYVIGTGESHSIDEFLDEALSVVGMTREDISIAFKHDSSLNRVNDVKDLIANPKKAKKAFDWKPKTTFKQLVKMMVTADMEAIKCQRQT